MRRGKPLRRGPMRRKRGSTSYARRERDTLRMAWIKTLPCAVRIQEMALARGERVTWFGPSPDACRRDVEAHHAGVHGLSHKAPDETCIPLCDHHHDALTDRSGVFAGWPRHAVKTWELEQIAFYQAAYERHVAARATDIY